MQQHTLFCRLCCKQVEESRVSGVHKGTVVRGELDCPSGQLHITDCHDTVVYALAPLQVGL